MVATVAGLKSYKVSGVGLQCILSPIVVGICVAGLPNRRRGQAHEEPQGEASDNPPQGNIQGEQGTLSGKSPDREDLAARFDVASSPGLGPDGWPTGNIPALALAVGSLEGDQVVTLPLLKQLGKGIRQQSKATVEPVRRGPSTCLNDTDTECR